FVVVVVVVVLLCARDLSKDLAAMCSKGQKIPLNKQSILIARPSVPRVIIIVYKGSLADFKGYITLPAQTFTGKVITRSSCLATFFPL
ncbi:hypothetical protein GGI42DRAFT_325576, partial [Trichoderma sp. SZMC 28013]